MASYNLEAPRCQHIKDNGIRCGSPALRGKQFCYHHQRAHFSRHLPGVGGYFIPPLETPESVTLVALQIAQAAHDGTIGLPLARFMLSAVRFAAPYAVKHSTYPPDVVTELPPAMEAVCNINFRPTLPMAPDQQFTDSSDDQIPGCPDDQVTTSDDDSPSQENSQSPASDEQLVKAPNPIRDSIFHLDPAAVRAYWTQHLPPDVANLRSPNGELIYEPPNWLPLTPEQLAYLREHDPPENSRGTREERENHERVILHFSCLQVQPPHPEEILHLHAEAQAREHSWRDLLCAPSPSPVNEECGSALGT